MSAISLPIESYRPLGRPSPSFSVRVCSDRPDWSAYAWSDPGRVVYGPVSSRRLGASLGVNFFPDGKVCSFRCAYCDLDTHDLNQPKPSLVPGELLSARVLRGLHDHVDGGAPVPDSITFAGNGEPTLHPWFARIVRSVQSFRDARLPDVPLNLFSNGMHLTRPEVLASLSMFHRVYLKLDGGSPEVVARMNGPEVWRGVQRAMSLCRQRDNISASTMLVGGRHDNVADVQSPAYLALVHKLDPRELYLYTLDYPSPDPDLRPVSLDAMMECGSWLSHQLDCPVIVLWRQHVHPHVERVVARDG